MTSRLRIDRAARIIAAGGVIAYPTEAVYGLGCLPLNADAVERVIAIKQRDARKGLILVGDSIERINEFAALPGGEIGKQIAASWPGPVTWVLPALPGTPPVLTGGRTTIAVRVSDHPLVRQLCRRVGSALVSTSANRSRRRPARSALAVRRWLGSDIDDVLAGPLGGSVRPTEIRDGATGRVLRPG